MSKDTPSSFDIQKDINDFLSKKYGGKVVISNPSVEGGEEGVHAEQKKGDIHFELKPIELENYLKKYIVQQEDAIDVVATKICTHFNRMAYEKKNPDKGKIVGGIKGNVLLIGPTGVGKTYMIKLIADKLGVPFVKGDATKFTETGYVGGDVEDLVRDLVREANGDIAIAEYGIIYLDEVDKIASSTNHFGPDVSRSGVQRNLLKIMEDSDVDLKNPLDIASQMEAAMQAQKTGKIERKKINTKNILFVMSGAFQGLIDIIKKRLNTQQIGFIQDEKTKKNDELNWLKYVAKQDLIEFGFESEFVGRLPILAILDDLDVDGLYQILLNPNSSVILGKKRDFHAYGIDTEFEDKALKKIAEASHKEKTGARGLVSVLEKILIKFEKFLPSTSIKKLVINEELLDNPDIVLEKLLIQDAINRIIDEYIEKHGITLTFTDNAKDSIKLKSKENKLTPYDYCHKILTNYEYGLKLIGLSQFEVTDDVVNNYDHFLDDLIKNRSYSSVKQNKKV